MAKLPITTGRRSPNGCSRVFPSPSPQTDEASMRTISDLVRDQRPLILPPDASVIEAARQMRERRVGAVLVPADDARLVGIFPGRDAVDRVLAEGRDPAA